jgi:glutamate N-acetyltransferase/amino-acid N-acetyltransferase
MAVGLKEPETLLPVKGIRAAAISCGIKKKQGSKDLVLFEIAAGSHTAAVFTRNLFCAAPVTLAKQHLSSAAPKYLLINSGNANAGTGARGMSDAQACCKMLADTTGCKPEEVLPFSTGVIGEYLPLQKFADGIPQAIVALKENAWIEAGRGIMTTDTLMKGISKQIVIEGKTITISGVAKGSGMIHPNMATMLGYVATDAAVSQSLLQEILQSAVNKSFNAISVDGDTSTNDSCVLIATGKAQNREIIARDESYKLLHQAVDDVCQYLAQAIVRDGEGATKLIILDVVNAVSESDARQAAFTIAHSPLVKTALFASDPNWGRILAAVGRSGVTMNMEKIRIHLGDVCIVENGGRATSYTEEQGQRVMAADEITIRVDLAAGNSSARVWTCDLSYEYVKINAEYRT